FVSLNDYRCVIWMLGEESTADDTLSAAEQAAVNAYLASGKPVSLFVSGAEVGWDLDYKGTSTDKAFMNTALSATYHADDANTHSVTGAAGMMFDGLSFSFGDGTSGAMGDYDVDYPDVLNTSGGSTAVLTYSNGAGAAATYRESGDTRVLTVGFPWERILGVAERNSAMAKALAVLLPDWQAPAEGNGDGGAGNLGGPAGGCGAVANADAMTLPLLALLLALLAWRRRD
ncbi:MAG: MYXO-CTERM sorting domain-containing protein, partial [Planctomycetota bacterium]